MPDYDKIIEQLVEAAPDLTPEQIGKLQVLFAPNRQVPRMPETPSEPPVSTRWVLDPTDPTVAFLASGTDDVWGAAVGAVTLQNVHLIDRCAGRPCIIHAPSDHHMRDWPVHWRGDRGMTERICPHGIGHPDPDQIGDSTHGCDGCCVPAQNPP